MTLTKADLVQKVYQHHENMTKQQAIEAVEAFLRLSKGSLISELGSSAQWVRQVQRAR